MTRQAVEGISFEPPPGLEREEVMASFRVPAKAGLRDARVEHPIRPNLVVHRRPAKPGSDLAAVVASVREQLVKSLLGMSPIESADITFADGAKGVLLAFSFPAPQGLSCAQLQALRLDGGTVTSLTMTTEESHLTPGDRDAYLKALGSAKLAR